MCRSENIYLKKLRFHVHEALYVVVGTSLYVNEPDKNRANLRTYIQLFFYIIKIPVNSGNKREFEYFSTEKLILFYSPLHAFCRAELPVKICTGRAKV